MNLNYDLVNLEKKCVEFMEEKNVSKIYIYNWKKLHENNQKDNEDYESIENLILRDILNDKEITFFLKDNINIKRKVKEELYKVLCTSSEEYKNEINTIEEIVDNVIPVLSASLGGKYGIDIALMSGILSIVVCGIFKFGKNIWCSIYKEELKG